MKISPTTLLFLSAPSTFLLSYNGADSPNPNDLIFDDSTPSAINSFFTFSALFVDNSKLFVPKQYEIKEIKQLVKYAETKIEVVPATYKTVNEKILTKPPYPPWEKGKGEIEKVDN